MLNEETNEEPQDATDASPFAHGPDTASGILERLDRSYMAPEWVVMREVAPVTGGGTRYADAVAVNTYSSRGYAIHGFEVKVSRADWLRELRAPEKAEPVMRYCDAWFVVTPKDIVKDGELPVGWGHLVATPRGLRRAAPSRLKPQAITRAFFVSLVRRSFESLDRHAARMVASERSQMQTQIKMQVDRLVEQQRRQDTKALNAWQELQAATGLTLDPWGGPPVFVVKLAMALEHLCGKFDSSGDPVILKRLLDTADVAERTAAQLREAITTLTTGEAP